MGSNKTDALLFVFGRPWTGDYKEKVSRLLIDAVKDAPAGAVLELKMTQEEWDRAVESIP